MTDTNTVTPTPEALSETIQSLVDYCVERNLIGWEDRVWAYNTALECVGALGPAPAAAWVLADEPHVSALNPVPAAEYDLESALALVSEAAVANGVADDTASGRDRVAMRVMGALMPRPSQVTTEFHGRLDVGERHSATEWFYRMCCDCGYVRRAAIARNIAWTAPTRWGELEITINLSKPEKDPRDIAAAGAAPATDEVYPACQLCIENEGYPGRSAATGSEHPARQNLRIIPIELGAERWGLQYSPYAYFNEHCIAMSAEHRPMHVDRENLSRLLDFVDVLPHYFVGSNADLPIVGGSILSHDHFQGGRHTFPMMRAAVAEAFDIPNFENVTCEVLNWPLTVLRLRSNDRGELLDASCRVLDAWRAWSDTTVGVLAHDPDGTPHNTVTPVVCREGSAYVAYLALRCNTASDEHPMGVFHPHAEYHHIKKENIGLIEVMGLAILPPRLVGEMEAVRKHLLDARAMPDSAMAACGTEADAKSDDGSGAEAGIGADGGNAAEADLGASSDTACATALRAALESDPLSGPHAAWALEVAERHPQLTADDADPVLRQEIGAVFGHVLEDAGVFKWDDAGRAALHRFLTAL